MTVQTDQTVWLVVNPTRKSEVSDVISQTTLWSYGLMVRGGLDYEQKPALHTTRGEAVADAKERCEAVRRDMLELLADIEVDHAASLVEGERQR